MTDPTPATAAGRSHPWWRRHRWGPWEHGSLTFSQGPDEPTVSRAVDIRECYSGRRQVREPIGATFYG